MQLAGWRFVTGPFAVHQFLNILVFLQLQELARSSSLGVLYDAY
jgi:hypothetical protein